MEQRDTFNPVYFEQLKQAERNHFWFTMRRKWIFDRIRKFLPPPATVLEIGCGTGNISHFLAGKGYVVTGCEFYSEAINQSWPDFTIVQGDANNLPFADNSFDAVGLFDVIEHFENDIPPLREAWRVIREGGIIIISVPAREELWSWFDAVSFHKRRYTKEKIKKVFSELQVTILSIEYMFMSLYVPMKCMRTKEGKNEDLFKIHEFTNLFLREVLNIENLISKYLPLPIGTSIIAVAKKKHPVL